MHRIHTFAAYLLRLPVLWGTGASVAFYMLIDRGVVQHGLVRRYFASHPVETITTVLFFVGMAALAIKAVQLAIEFSGLHCTTLGAPPVDGQRIADVEGLLVRLDQVPQRLQGTYLTGRLREALNYVRRKGSADSLDEHLRHLADLDAERMHASHALVRIIIWAVPILGFLGTVIGITLAIANLSPEALENSLPQVTAGLGVAFDTTALALALSIVLMFAKFLVDRFEIRLLASVDGQVAAQLVGRFRDDPAKKDAQVLAVRRMAEAVIQAVETSAERHAQTWRSTINSTIDTVHQHWMGKTLSLSKAFERALSTSLEQHAKTLAAAEQALTAENRQHWNQVQMALVDAAASAKDQQNAIERTSRNLQQIVEATGQVTDLESALNHNLSTLASTRKFEDTVITLSAAIQLLSSRLSPSLAELSSIQLPANPATNDAA